MPPALTRILLLCETVLATTSADAAPKLVQPHRSVAIDGFGHAIEDAVLSPRLNEPQAAALAETHQKALSKAGIVAAPDQEYKNIWKYLRQIKKALRQKPMAMAQREGESARVVENGTELKTKVINIIVKPRKQNETGLLKMLKQEMDELDPKDRKKFARNIASLLMKKLDLPTTNETESQESDEAPTKSQLSIESLGALLNRLQGKPTNTSPPNEEDSTSNEEEELKAATTKAKKLLAKLEVNRLRNVSEAAQNALNRQQESKSKAKPHSRNGKGQMANQRTLKQILEHLATPVDGDIESDAG